MLSPSHIQKIQSLDTSKPLLPQLPGVTCQVCAAFGSLQRTAVALKHNVYDDGGLYRL